VPSAGAVARPARNQTRGTRFGSSFQNETLRGPVQPRRPDACRESERTIIFRPDNRIDEKPSDRCPKVMNNSAAEFQDLLDEFGSSFKSAASQRECVYKQFLGDFDSAFKEARIDRAVTTPHLGLLSPFGLKYRELCHSRILRWFLDPNSEHEQSSLFLDALLTELNIPITAGEDVILQLEKPDRVDISVYSPKKFAVFFENKVFHKERDHQFNDLIESLNKLSDANEISSKARAAVFLTDDGRKPTSGPADGIACCFRRVTLFGIFDKALEQAPVKSALLTHFLKAYLNEISGLQPNL